MASPLELAKRRGYRAFTMPVLLRDAMIPFQEYVNRVRQSVVAIQAQGGTGAEWVLAGAAGLAPGDAATVAKALELAMPAVSLSLVRQLRTRQLSPAAATAMSHLPLIAATLAHSRIIAATL